MDPTSLPSTSSDQQIGDVAGPSTSSNNGLGSLNATMMLKSLAEQSVAGPSNVEGDQTRKKSVFHIDTSLIVGAPSAEQVCTRFLRKKYGVADYQYFKNGKTQQCDIFRLNKYNACLVACEVSTPCVKRN